MISNTFIKRAGIAFAALSAAAGIAYAAAAQDADGLAGMHDLRREGKRLCMSDHFHYGSSSGESSKRAAQIAAAASWSDFTAFEYGSAWASFNKSASKEVSCKQSSGGWGCDVSSRPCR